MSKPGGKIPAGIHVGSGNRILAERFNRAYRQKNGWDSVLGNRHAPRSKYMPHQNEREYARRRKGFKDV